MSHSNSEHRTLIMSDKYPREEAIRHEELCLLLTHLSIEFVHKKKRFLLPVPLAHYLLWEIVELLLVSSWAA